MLQRRPETYPEINQQTTQRQEEEASPRRMEDTAGVDELEVNYAVEIQHNIEESINSERKEKKLPPVHFEVFLLTHINAVDLHGVQDRFNEADLFVVENAGWTPSLKSLWRNVSLARITPEQALSELRSTMGNDDETPFEEFFLELFKIIYGSNKPIVFADYPYDDPHLWELHDNIMDASTCSPTSEVPFDKKIVEAMAHLKTLADLQQRREDYMLSHLEEAIEDATIDRPDLKEKPSLRGLITIGSLHTGIFHALKRKDQDTKQTHTGMPTIYSYDDEVVRRFLFHKSVSKELVASALLETMLSHLIRTAILDATNENLFIVPYVRKVAEQFTYQEIEDIFQRNSEDAIDRVFFYLEQKAISQPESLDDIKQFLHVQPRYSIRNGSKE
ncbi:MAG: hypothetical protein WC052_00155 [Patescibacteria group bacterium]